MSYLVFCTFDLKGASSQDYQAAYKDLAALGLAKVHVASNGTNVVIPTTSVMGAFDGSNATNVRDDLFARVQAAFVARGFRSEIFMTAGGSDWGWLGQTT
jgi:hypothetical protein